FYNNRAKSRLSCVPHSMRGSPVLPCAVVAGCWVQDWVFPIFNRRLRIKTLLLPNRLVLLPESEDEQIALRSWRARRHTNFVFAERPTPYRQVPMKLDHLVGCAKARSCATCARVGTSPAQAPAPLPTLRFNASGTRCRRQRQRC